MKTLRAPIVRSLEADRFGLVAQVLTERDACQPAACYAFDFLQRREQIVANMNDRAYDARVTQFAASWNEKPGTPTGAVLASQPGTVRAAEAYAGQYRIPDRRLDPGGQHHVE